MSNPPPEWDDNLRTHTQRLADDIAQQAGIIRRDWDDVYEATAPANRAGSTSKSAHITLNDADQSAADLDATTRLMHLRRNAADVLNQWCRLVMDERPVTNPASLPLGNDVKQMCAFLERQADWLSETEYATDARDELRDIARSVQAYTDPYKREWHRLGICPFIVDDRFCEGTVRVRIGSDDDNAQCDRCEQDGPIEWWVSVINGKEEPLTSAAIAKKLSMQLGVTVNERTLRRWAAAEKITRWEPYGPQVEDPPYLFLASKVIDEVACMDRQCPTCGKLWSGRGNVCYRCYAVVAGGTPRYAEKGDGQWVKVAPIPPRKIKAVVGRLPIENDVCEMSDLPKSWCACGLHAS